MWFTAYPASTIAAAPGASVLTTLADERLWRASTEADVAAVLAAFWTPGDASLRAKDTLLDWMERAMQFFLDQFERFVKGEPLMNVVDKKLGY